MAGDREFLVHWRPCMENKYDKQETTWETEDCEYIKGGMRRYIEMYFADLHQEKAGKEKRKKNGEEEADEHDEAEDEEDPDAEADPEEEEPDAEADKKKKASKKKVAAKKKAAGATGGERKKPAGKRKAKEVEEPDKEQEPEDEEDEEELGSDVSESKIGDLQACMVALTKTTRTVLKQQADMVGFGEKVSAAIEKMAGREASGGGAAGDKAETKKTGTLKFWEMWEEKGPEKFRRYISTKNWYKMEKIEDATREVETRMNGFVARREHTEDELLEALEAEDNNKEDVALRAVANEKAKQWISVLEDLYMAHLCWLAT